MMDSGALSSCSRTKRPETRNRGTVTVLARRAGRRSLEHHQRYLAVTSEEPVTEGVQKLLKDRWQGGTLRTTLQAPGQPLRPMQEK